MIIAKSTDSGTRKLLSGNFIWEVRTESPFLILKATWVNSGRTHITARRLCVTVETTVSRLDQSYRFLDGPASALPCPVPPPSPLPTAERHGLCHSLCFSLPTGTAGEASSPFWSTRL